MAARTAKQSMFTPSGPHATSKPAGRATRIDISSTTPPPADETPAQKVARLREAARRAKLANESRFDRVVTVGRVWADRAHRATTYGLIGFTAVAGVLVTLALGDMLIYNRRKRNEWNASLKAEYAKKLAEAQQAVEAGTATEAQVKFLEIEREEEEKKAQRKERGLWKAIKQTVFAGYSLQEQKGGKLGIGAGNTQTVEHDAAKAGGEDGLGVVKAVQDMVNESRTASADGVAVDRPWTSDQATGDAGRKPVGGPLDRLGEEAAASVGQSSRSWWNRATGR